MIIDTCLSCLTVNPIWRDVNKANCIIVEECGVPIQNNNQNSLNCDLLQKWAGLISGTLRKIHLLCRACSAG